MERTETDFFNVPPLKLDLSQAHSLRVTNHPSIYEGDAAQFDEYGREIGVAKTTGNPQLVQLRQALQEVVTGLTAATQTALESQHHYFETVIKELQDTVQSALNDIDTRLNLLSQAQGQSEEALDAFIKIFLFGGNKKFNLDDQTKIVNDFLKRGLVVPVATAPTTPCNGSETQEFLTGIAGA